MYIYIHAHIYTHTQMIAYICIFIHIKVGASLLAQSVKNLPAMQETHVRFLGWEDPLKGEMATHSNIVAWRIPWTEEPGSLQSMVSQVRHDLVTKPPHIDTM